MKMKNNKKAVVLLSGGLDSLVSIAVENEEIDIALAITFDYGQKSFENEKLASQKISEFYNIEHKIIKLDWLNSISQSTLNTNEEVPILNKEEIDDIERSRESAISVWVANRNALFINIAACFAERNNYDYIIIGANKEEAKTFKDNSKEFIEAINCSLKESTQNSVSVKAPLINMDKNEIVKKGIELKVPFQYLHSCYLGKEKQCGICESCLRLKRALELNNRYDIIEEIFE